MTRQALYRLQQLAAGLCGRGCGRPRWDERTMCERCTRDMREQQNERRRARAEEQRRLRTAA